MQDSTTEAAAAEMPPAIPLEVDALMQAAAEATGLSDFGDLSFKKGLEIMVQDLNTTANLHEGGKIGQAYGIVRMLSNRLRYLDDVKKHPEIRDEKIIAPIVIAGLPRTGTSKLQRVMSGDPGVQRLEMWKLMNPAPFPGEEPGNPVERIAFAKGVEEVFRTQFPGWMARHPMEAEQPDEELFIMEMSLECTVSAMVARMPNFREYTMQVDPRPTYKILFEMMQYLQWQDGGARGRPWIMKSPVHVGYLDILFEFFPDATVVHSHRSPQKTVPSFASTIYELRKTSTESIDPVEVGQEWFDYWARLTDRYLQVRDTLPHEQIVNTHFDEVCNDPISVISKVYEKAGRELTPEAIAGCKEYDESRPANHWGAYGYTQEEFGLSPEAIDKRFAEYLKLFG